MRAGAEPDDRIAKLATPCRMEAKLILQTLVVYTFPGLKSSDIESASFMTDLGADVE